uniref:Sortilin-related receptor n=1 Tax=Timema bartmani TaxID=61472 RepID=A0A7R9F0L4_9NEOP|nr:unnamed protein product [Timema bartmani]
MRNNCVYWADIVNDTISRQCLSDGSQGAEILVKTNLDSIEGMALDWVSNTLYFVDGMRTKIEVVRTDIHYEGRMRRTILDSRNLKKPRGIAVHPMEGFIFWTDWAPGDPSLSRANLDGSDVKRLFVKPRVEWPNGITIDHIAERIYWVDAKLDYIASAALDGSKFKEIIANDVRVKHPFAVAVFKDNLYWDDWEQKAIFTADKDHGVEVHAILNQLAGLMDLKVFAHSIQEGNNSCGLTTNVCSHLCVGLPQRKSACLCPDTMVMKNNECMCPENKPAFANGTCPSCQYVLNTCTTEQFSCSNSVCIPRTWMCDGTNDCGDNSDEMNCSHPHCPAKLFSCGDGKCIEPYWRLKKRDLYISSPHVLIIVHNCEWFRGEFRCAKDSVCIPSTWRCDGEKDCADNSDETSCVAVKCESWQFKCKNNRCIFMSWRCDGDNDCGEDDSSDEENCTVTHEPTERPPDMPFLPTNSCNSWMFTCSNHKCVPYWWKCDGVDDCGDKSDEIGCGALVPTLTPSSSTHTPHSFTCKENEFRCYTGDCILESWVCDGTGDCPGEEDEENCKEVVRCGVNEFMCRKDGSCIHMSWVCDGKIDCPDNSDEVACVRNNTTSAPATPSCHSGFFPCDINLCLPMVKLCDGHQDCYDGFDEGRNCNNATTKVFQVQMSVGDHRTNSSSLLLVWWLPMSTNAPLEYLPSICELNSMGKWINSTWTSDFEHWFTGLKAYARYNMTVFVREKDNANKVFPPAQYIAATTAEGAKSKVNSCGTITTFPADESSLSLVTCVTGIPRYLRATLEMHYDCLVSTTVPSPPWNLTVVQLTSSQVQVSWMAPAQPNGIIQEYTVFLSPPIPPLSRKTTSDQQSVVIESTYKPGQIYSYWVRARNGAAESNDSRPQTLLFDESSVIGSIQGLVITSKNDYSVVLSWKPLNKVEGYRVYPRANPPLPRLDSFIVSENNVTVSNLSPGMTYVVEICGFRLPLPEISGLNGTVLKQHGTTVTLLWDAPKYSIKQHWEYGIYYALNIQELFDKPKLRTQNMNATVSGLEACESYVFAVGLVGPLGSGPLSSHPYSILTEFNPDAPPKNLHATTDPTNETRVLVTWQSSCPEMDTAVNYSVTIEELTHGQSSTVTLLPTTNTTLNYWFNTRHGGRYRLSVRTGRVHSNSSRVVEYTAPIILPPGQVQVLPEKNGSYFVYWKETKLPDALQGKK